jgi:NMD protein affecting ribosome stability and mRNA decay
MTELTVCICPRCDCEVIVEDGDPEELVRCPTCNETATRQYWIDEHGTDAEIAADGQISDPYGQVIGRVQP